MSWSDATAACKELGNGWRLPTISELKFLFKKKDEIGGLFKTGYWSSTEIGDDYAWSFTFYGGAANASGSSKYDTSGVRAVRAF